MKKDVPGDLNQDKSIKNDVPGNGNFVNQDKSMKKDTAYLDIRPALKAAIIVSFLHKILPILRTIVGPIFARF
jgi:hypothetical protein